MKPTLVLNSYNLKVLLLMCFVVGCLFKEFSENVYTEVKRLKENVQEEPHPSESVQEEPRPSSDASSESELENSTFDIDEGVDLDKTNDCDEEIQKLFSGKNVRYIVYLFLFQNHNFHPK